MHNNMDKDVRVLGMLYEQDELEYVTGDPYKKPIFRNNVDKFQFMVKPISETPDEFFDTKIFNIFEPQLSPEIDAVIERYGLWEQNKINTWFESKAIIFTPKETNAGHYNAEDTVVLVDLPASHNGNTKYVPVPLFDLKRLNLSLEDFESKLHKNEWINLWSGISKASEDVFPMIICEAEDDYYMYGNIVNKECGYNGIRLFFEKNVVKRAKFDLNDGNDIVSDDDYYVQFIPNDLIVKYESLLQVLEDNEIKRAIPIVIEEKFEEAEEVIEVAENLTNNVEEFTMEVAAKNVEITKEISNDSSNGEMEFLQQFYNVVQNEGMLYDETDLLNFHVAMKSSNLVILSGMSGTGKSKLVRLYAKALGPGEKTVNKLKVVPVKPSWTDDSDLLGYLDTTNMVYRPSDTGIVDVLVNAAKNPNAINIICLDEMNLSRVEHYFSQFLSILEDNENDRVVKLYNKNIEGRVYNASDYPAEIKIGKNVIFVGTVNVDESTYHFSDKVLDRANVIKLHNRNFLDLKELLNKDRKELAIKAISMKTFAGFKNAKSDSALVLTDDEINLLNEINVAMIDNLPNCAIGYRIIRQIDLYLKNLPETEIYPKSKAIDYLLVQRVFTKLRGSEEQLKKLVGRLDDAGLLVDSIIIDILNRYGMVSGFDESKKIITTKAKELVTYGYTI